MSNNKKVIPFPRSKIWTFFDWVDLDGSNPIERWLEKQSDEVGWLFNSTLKEAQKRSNPHEWTCKLRFLKGKYAQEHLWEVKFIAESKQYRILGRFDGAMVAILLCGCFHKGSVYSPEEALDTAMKRSKALARGKADRHERKIEDDL